MPNNIETAVRYTNNESVINQLYESYSTTTSWEKPCVFLGAKTIKIRVVKLGTTALGDFDRENGYSKGNITVNWVEKTLTQDKGDSLYMDKMEGEEAQALELVSIYNTYKKKVEIPSIDKYRYATVIANAKIHKTTGVISDDKELINAIKADIVYLKNLKAFANAELRISETNLSLLQDNVEEKARFTLGSPVNADAPIMKYRGAIVIPVPDDELQCAYILCSPLAISAQRKYQETVYFESVPGYGNRRKQVDTGVYHDIYIEPGTEEAVCVHTGKTV